MRPIQVLVCFLTALSRTQAEIESTGTVTSDVTAAGVGTTIPSVPVTANNNENFNSDAQLATDGSTSLTSASQTSNQPEFIMVRPDGPGLHAGFQAVGSNYATTVSGGIKSPDGTTLETGLNIAGRFGDSGVTRSSTRQSGSTGTQQQSERSTQQRATQGTGLPLDGATFAVSYKPGLLSAIGNMLNPMRMFQQFGDALANFTGFGQGNTMSQTQTQYSPPQTRSSNSNSNGVGITWKPLYRALTFS